MIGSFVSGLSGLRANQTSLEVIGNNISNVNTIAYKSARVDFSDILSQTLRGSTEQSAAVQVGRGTQVAAVRTMMAQGGFENSSSPSDLAIQGNGFFVVANEDGQNLFTRAGNFTLNVAGQLVTNEGFTVQGFNAVDGQVPVTASLEAIQFPRQTLPPKATTNLGFRGNLDSSSPVVATNISGEELRVGGRDGIIGSFIDGSVSLVDDGATINVTGLGTTFTDLTPGDTLIIDGRSFTIDQVTDDTNMTLTRPTLTGTIEGTAGSNVITGTDTAFTSELRVGDTLLIDGVDTLITAIRSDTQLTVAAELANDIPAGGVLDFGATAGIVPTESSAETTTAPSGTTVVSDLPIENLSVSPNGSTNILVEDTISGEMVVVNIAGTDTLDDMAATIRESGISGYTLNDQQFQLSQLDPENGTSTSFSFIDSQGTRHVGIMSYFRTEETATWAWRIDIPAAANVTQDPSFNFVRNTRGTIHFNDNGQVESFRNLSGADQFSLQFAAQEGSQPVSVSMNRSAVERITQFELSGDVVVVENNGAVAGAFESFTVDANGQVLGSFSNGETRVIAQILLADFANAEGLQRAGSNLFQQTLTSGDPEFGTAGQGGLGRMISGALELSNIDLAQEFTSMIMAQRGFQASANVITTSDTIMNDVLNLKRG